MSDQQPLESDEPEGGKPKGHEHDPRYIGFGLAVGVAIGAGMGNIAVGIALGLVFGLALSRRKRGG
ncbi:MAG: hypothetical protein HWE08_14140 [Alphaproteobacteria bacterium]|nr:hypothetical protein [Alphaproteobacteria bacterium]